MNTTKAKVLIVEDEVIVAEDLATRLMRLGYEVTASCLNGADALEAAARQQPDIVLMDIMLQGALDGIDAADRLRKDFAAPVIFVTAYADAATIERAKTAEPFGYIIKPFDEREIHSAIEIALYKHKMDRVLREREEWFATTLRSIGDGIISCDRAGKITFMNPVAELLTGWKLADAIGADLPDVFTAFNEETRSRIECPTVRVLRDGATVDLANHTMLIARNGTEVFIEDVATPIRNDRGDLTGAVLVFRDVGERKEAERRLRAREQLYRTLAEASRDMIFIVNRDDVIEFVNSSGARLIGMEATLVIGRKRADIFTNDTDLDVSADLRRVFESKEAARRDSTTQVGGVQRWLNSWLIPLFDDAHEVTSVMCVARDITEQKQAEETITRYSDELREMNASKDRFISILSHDLRGPFNPLLGFCELLMMDAETLTPDEVKLYSQEMYESLKKQFALLENLLTWSRLQTGTLTLRPHRLNVRAVIDEIAGLFAVQIRRKQLALTNDIPPGIFLHADDYMMRSVFQNLISNAIKFTPRHGRVTVSFAECANRIEISISDTGVGIPSNEMQNLFRLDAMHSSLGTENERGSGLGLIICREMIEKHGGSLSAKSTMGEGTTFTISLPADTTHA